MIHTKYLKNCGHIIGYRDISGDVATHETAEVGFYPGEYQAATTYFDTNGDPQARVQATGTSVNKTKIVADGVDTVTVTGLPNPCWYRAAAREPELNSTGTLSFSTANPGTYTFEVVGHYFTPNPLIVTALTPIQSARNADAKWAALKSATPAQIDAWIDSNVTTLAQAKELFKLIVKALRALNDKYENP